MIGELFTVATNMRSIGGWIEEHPYATGGIVFGGGLVLLWMFGYIGGGSGDGNSGSSNLAAAYYGAEAAQTTAGTQLQMATVQANAQQGIATTQANAAVALGHIQADMQTTLGQQTANVANTQTVNDTIVANHSADDALATVNSNNYFANLTATTHDNTSVALAALNGIIPQALYYGGASGAGGYVPGLGSFAIGSGSGAAGGNPNVLRAAGYTPSQINAIVGTA